MRLILLGPPGAGKGTQARRIAERLGVSAVSTGDIFRANVGAGTELGRRAKQYVDAGEYVPDDVTNAMVRDRLGDPDVSDGFLLDGYPRTRQQVETLDGMLAEQGVALDRVVELVVGRDELVARLLKRAQLDGRSDDTPEVIAHRLDVYDEQTAPLVEVYSSRGLLVTIDGVGSMDDVTGRVLGALDHRVS
ncbi:MAG: adenylate kinase [Kineosporiaceae bacterium]